MQFNWIILRNWKIFFSSLDNLETIVLGKTAGFNQDWSCYLLVACFQNVLWLSPNIKAYIINTGSMNIEVLVFRKLSFSTCCSTLCSWVSNISLCPHFKIQISFTACKNTNVLLTRDIRHNRSLLYKFRSEPLTHVFL